MTDEQEPREPEPGGVPAPVDPWADADRAGTGPAESAPDETVAHQPAFDETVEQPPAASAEGGAGPSGTAVLPPVPPAEAPSPRWSARAEVPRAGSYDERTAYPPVEEMPPAGWSQRQRGVGFPLLITAAALILLLIIGIGVYLLLDGGRDSPVVPPSTAPPITATATTAPTTTTTTVPPTTSVAPVRVEVPDVRGVDYGTALTALTQRGLFGSRVDEASADVPAGLVIRTEPAVGQSIDRGSVVTVVVSTGAPPTTPPSPSPSA